MNDKDKLKQDEYVAQASCYIFDPVVKQLMPFGRRISEGGILNAFIKAQSGIDLLKIECPDFTRTVMMPSICRVVDIHEARMLSDRIMEHLCRMQGPNASTSRLMTEADKKALEEVMKLNIDRMKTEFMDYLIANGFISLEIDKNSFGNSPRMTMRAYIHHPDTVFKDTVE